MKLCLAQTRPRTGDLGANVTTHLRLAKSAAEAGCDLILFGELSLTGYEPSLAASLATLVTDHRLAPLQALSDSSGIAIGAGLPTPGKNRPRIAMALFRAGQPAYSLGKHYLHADEASFFEPDSRIPLVTVAGERVAIAICYELSVPEHAQDSIAAGAELYLASVAKTLSGVESAARRLATITTDFGLPAAMVNLTGPNDTFVAAGGSGGWDKAGQALGRLGNHDEGLLLLDF